MTDQEAQTSVGKWVTVDESVAQLRLKYVPISAGTVGPEYGPVFSTGPKDPTDDRLAVSLATPSYRALVTDH